MFGDHSFGNGRYKACYNHGSIIGLRSGGIVGTSWINPVRIINCGSDFNSYIKGENCCGGIFGNSTNYAQIYILNTYCLGKLSGNKVVGGICGSGNVWRGNQQIDNCYFAGTIEGGTDVGAIMGKNNNGDATMLQINNCYYKDIIAKAVSNVENVGATALSEEDMKGNDTLFNSLKSYTNSEYELSEWKKDVNQYPIHSD